MHNLILMVSGMITAGLLTTSVTFTNTDTSEQVYQDTLVVQFQQEGQQIEDPELKAYFELLMENMSSHLASAETTGVEDYSPDIEGIYRASLTAPFQQAGQQIEDPMLRAVYDRLIGEIGLD